MSLIIPDLATLSDENLEKGLAFWRNHYQKRLGRCDVHTDPADPSTYFLRSALLRKGNHPQLYYHGKKTKHILVLTHGLSDCPWYVHFIAREFFNAGLNVIMPLLPGHGLIEPDKAMEDSDLSAKWKLEIDNSVVLASILGDTISIGGFSTGGALSYNKVLRNPELIKGGLFLFSGALNIGDFIQLVTRLGFVGEIIKLKDGKIKSEGPDPYKYGTFPEYGGVEVAEIDRANEQLEENRKLQIPIFSAHSANDTTAKIEGILDVFANHATIASGFLIGQNVLHAEVPLKEDVPVDMKKAGKDYAPPKKNPQFKEMMKAAIDFLQLHVLS